MRKYKPTLGDWGNVVHQGKFIIKKAYKALRGSHQKLAWKSIACNNTASPRSVFMLWLVLRGAIRTKDKLMEWGVIRDGSCCFCNDTTESVSHLFF